jgi:hypothetical protein
MIEPPVTFLSGRQHVMPKLGATTLEYYKLVPQPTPQSNCAPSEPALTSNRPHSSPIWDFPQINQEPRRV